MNDMLIQFYSLKDNKRYNNFIETFICNFSCWFNNNKPTNFVLCFNKEVYYKTVT